MQSQTDPIAAMLRSQTFEEEAEFRAGIDDTRGKRKAEGQSSAAQPSQATLLAREEERAAQQLQTAALAYVRCLQQLLQVCWCYTRTVPQLVCDEACPIRTECKHSLNTPVKTD
jgi:hypothetical protein